MLHVSPASRLQAPARRRFHRLAAVIAAGGASAGLLGCQVTPERRGIGGFGMAGGYEKPERRAQVAPVPAPAAAPAAASAPAAVAGGAGGGGVDWFTMARAEHRAIDARFERLSTSGDPAERALLRAALADALTLHAVEEENVIYPALYAAGFAEDPFKLYEEHAQMKMVLAELDMIAKDSPAWGGRIGALWRHVRAHTQDEETRVYPMLRETLTAELEVVLSQAYRREGAKFLPLRA